MFWGSLPPIPPLFKTCAPAATAEEVGEVAMFIPHDPSPGHSWLAQGWTPDLRSAHPLAGQKLIRFKLQILNSENQRPLSVGGSYLNKPTAGEQATVTSEKQQIKYKEIPMRLSADFSAETPQARRE